MGEGIKKAQGHKGHGEGSEVAEKRCSGRRSAAKFSGYLNRET